MHLDNKANPYPILILGVVSVSFAAIFIKLADAPSTVIAFYRMALAFALILPISLYTSPKDFKHYSFRTILLAMLAGLCLALHFYSWIASFSYTSVASSTAIVTTQPIFVVLFSYLLWKEKISLIQLLSVLLAVAGGLIIGVADVYGVGRSALTGDLLALAGALFAALYFLAGKKVLETVNLYSYITVAYGTSAIVLGIITKQRSLPLYGYGATTWASFAALAIICTLIGHSSLNWSLKHVPAPVVSMSTLGEPIGASLWAMLFFNERLSQLQLLGALLLLAGIYFFIAKREKRKLLQKSS